MNPISNFHHGHETSTPKWGAAYDTAPTWRDHANCAGTDTTAVFYDDDPLYTTARQLCANCPVQPDCLADALDDKFAADGFRAGHTPKERKALRRRRLTLVPAARSDLEGEK